MFDKMKLVLLCKQAFVPESKEVSNHLCIFSLFVFDFSFLNSVKHIVAHIISKKEASDYNRMSHESNVIMSDWFKKKKKEEEAGALWAMRFENLTLE